MYGFCLRVPVASYNNNDTDCLADIERERESNGEREAEREKNSKLNREREKETMKVSMKEEKDR